MPALTWVSEEDSRADFRKSSDWEEKAKNEKIEREVREW